MVSASFLLSTLAWVPSLAQSSKHVQPRHGYDFTRPQAGEILPNPTNGTGSAPQLRTYVTVKEMAPTHPAGAAASDPAAQNARADQTSVARANDTRGAPEPLPVAQRSGSERNLDAEDWRSSETVRVARHVETVLAEQIANAGLDATFTYRPSAAAQTDPALRLAEQRSWDRIVQSLAGSWQDWKSDHVMEMRMPPVEPGGPSLIAGKANANPPTGDTQSVPGVIVLRGAPPSVTGDIPDVAP